MTATTNAPRRRGKPPGSLMANRPPAAALELLAENGPTERAALLNVLSARFPDVTEHANQETMRRLHDLGYVRTKVWLTPEGLDALRKLGAAPVFSGAAREEAAA